MMKLLCVCVLVVAATAHVSVEFDASSANRGLPVGWTADQRSGPEERLELVFALKQTHLDELESTLLAVSTPGDPRYGQHLTNEEVHTLIAPEVSSVEAVFAFLKEHNITGKALTSNSDFIRAHVTVSEAEALLSTQYYLFEHNSGEQAVHRVMEYSLPEHVAAAVDFVSPTVHVPPSPTRNAEGLKIDVSSSSSSGSSSGSSSSEPSINTPSHLRELYNVTVEGTAELNSMAVTAFLTQHYSKSDLHTFWDKYCDGITCGLGDPTFKGDDEPGYGGVEAMLDIETITGIAGNIHAEFWGYSGVSPDNALNEPFLKWLTDMASTADADVPYIMSTSYGEDEDSWSYAAAARLNTEFQKAGARGISLLYSSGDSGANCQDGVYKPTTPSSSPWVTSVGGTTGGFSGSAEEAISLSSGGFSNRWASPAYQTTAVKAYLTGAKDLPDSANGYNVSGRAYPDISAQASNFDVIADGDHQGVAGTSCATPATAGVIALLNDVRLNAGKPVLGFLNPWIYQNAGMWNDITEGYSGGCSGSHGWPAAEGWDAVTGVGTPNYGALLEAL